jgi:hypothetical protein
VATTPTYALRYQVAGDPPDGAALGLNLATDVEAQIVRVDNPPSCRCNRTTDLSIAHNTLTAVAFTDERHDTNAMHDPSTNNSRITMPIAGVYAVGFTVQFASGSDYTRVYGALRMDGTTDLCRDGRAYSTSGGGGPAMTLHTVYKFAASAYIEATVLHLNSAVAARNILGSTAGCAEMWATWIGIG